MHVVGLGKHHELLDGLVLDLVVVRLAAEAERSLVHVDVETTSRGEVENVQEGGDSITSRLANLGLVNQGLIKESGSILFRLPVLAVGVLAFRLLTGRGTGDVETHLDELVATGGGLGTLGAGTS